MDMAVFYEVVVPLMEMERTSLICISTVMGSDNFYSKLLMLKDEQGRDFFKKFEFFLACQKCMDAGIASKCTHKMEELPQWQSARKHDRIRAMMQDQKQLLERETMGIMHDTNEKAFSGDLVQSFFKLREFEVYKPVSHVFLAIDPNAGGQSRFAIVSCIYMKGVCAIIGMEAINTHKPADYEGVLIEHIAALKARPNLKNALVVLMPEANLGFEAHYIERCVMQSRFARCCVTMRDREQPGLRTTHAVKESMYIKTKAAFADEAVRFAKNMVNVNPETTVESMKKDLQHEMRTYSVIIDHPLSLFAQSKKTFSGKIGGFQDDLVICLQLNILWHTQFYIDSKYGPYR